MGEPSTSPRRDGGVEAEAPGASRGERRAYPAASSVENRAQHLDDDEDYAAPRSAEVAARGIRTGEDFADLMSALMSDLLNDWIDPKVANSAIAASGQLLKVLELHYKYQRPGNQALLPRTANPNASVPLKAFKPAPDRAVTREEG